MKKINLLFDLLDKTSNRLRHFLFLFALMFFTMSGVTQAGDTVTYSCDVCSGNSDCGNELKCNNKRNNNGDKACAWDVISTDEYECRNLTCSDSSTEATCSSNVIGCAWHSAICIDNTAPVANAGTDQPVTTGATVTLDGSGSSDFDGDTLTYSWTMTYRPNGSSATLSGATTVAPTFTADLDGDYIIELIVNDGHVDSAADTVTIIASSANANPTFTSTPVTAAMVGLDYHYDVVVDDPNGDPVTIVGTTIPSWLDFNATTLSLTGTPADTDVGTHDVNLTASDGNGGTATQSFVITVAASASDVAISKVDSDDPVAVNTDFDYTISVTNRGSVTATDVNVTDNLPTGLDINLTTSNDDSPDWNCTRSGDVLTCALLADDGNISAGHTKTITLHATAPASTGTITNSASVTSNSDHDNSNNSATETTDIVSGSYQEIDEALELCYTDITDMTFGSNEDDCVRVGNFRYGDGCTAKVRIHAYEDNTVNLTDVNITKMYATSNKKVLDDGNCSATQGNCSGPNPFAPDWSPSYREAYMIPDVGTMAADHNMTITDVNTHNKKPLYQIAVHATYNYAGVYHYGRVYDCGGAGEGGISTVSSSDTIDTPITDATTAGYYNNSVIPNPVQPHLENPNTNIKYLQTMVAASQRNITGVYLNIETKTSEPYVFKGTGNPSPFVIIPYMVNNDNGKCGTDVTQFYDTAGDDFLIQVADGAYSGTNTMVIPDGVRKDARLQLIIVDPNGLSEEGQDCLAQSSTHGNLEGIGQCGNSEIQYTGGFGVDAWDRCGINNGKPCLSKHGGYSGGSDPTYPGYNPIYDNILGCYMCTFNIRPACSSDNFAVRPDRFISNITEDTSPYPEHPHYPNLLRSGEYYDTSLTAINADDAISSSYNVLDFQDVVQSPPAKKYFNNPTPPWLEDTEGLLQGSVPPPTAEDPSFMVNGISRLSNSAGTAEPIVGVTFDDVGRVGIYVADDIWSAVDNDDTPMDCNSSEHTYICAELNATFIPHHFGFAELNITNNAGPDSNFTYIADNRGMPTTGTLPTRSPMAARIVTRIEARNKLDGITQNFREDYDVDGDGTPELYYENKISVTQTVSIPAIRALPAEPHAYNYPNADESKIDDIKIGFGRTGAETDDPGTRNIKWNESTYPLEFNFHRAMNEPANPFDVNGSYLSISLVSDYTLNVTKTGQDPLVKGSRIGDRNTSTCIAPPVGSCVQDNAENNATFYYARTRPSKLFYDGITASTATTPIFIDIYCDLGFTACDDYGINTVSGQINDNDWWLSWNHSSSDGSITLSASTNGSVTNPDIDNSGGADKNVMVTHTSTTLPDIVDIDFDSATNAWLIYNPDNNWTPIPFYQVEFIGSTGWAGHGDTGHVVGGSSSIQKNRRLEQ